MTPARPVDPRPVDRSSAVVFGAGGNIGSHIVPHLGRVAGLRSVILVDCDVYEEKNLESQDIMWRDVGRFKAAVQAKRLRNINRSLTVIAIADVLENVPLGLLRASVLLSCLDSRIARQRVNEIAFRLNVPWIDAGVQAAGMLARVTAYRPGHNAPCLECLWDDEDYALLEQAQPCHGTGARVAPTNAPSSLGALAAALQVIECAKILAEDVRAHTFGREIVFNAAAHTQFVTQLHRHPRCRFDHETWAIRKTLSDSLTLCEVAALAGMNENGPRQLRVAGRWFAVDATCPGCQAIEPLWAVGPTGGCCRRCGGETSAPGSALGECLDLDALPEALQRKSLHAVGVRNGDVISVLTNARARHFEVATV